MSNLMAIVLAGGRGTRMEILCQFRPKPLLPFSGKYKVIDFGLSNIVHSQIRHIALFADYQRQQLRDYMENWYQQNARHLEINIMEPLTGAYAGSAEALYQHLEFIKNSDADEILILPSDHIYTMDYRKMQNYHEASKADVTIGAVQVPMKEAYRFGIITAQQDGRICEFIEKPAKPKGNMASMGIYIFNKDVLLNYLIEDMSKTDSVHDFGYSIIPSVIERGNTFVYKFEGFWRDIGTLDSYHRAHMELVRKNPFNCSHRPILSAVPESGTGNFTIDDTNSIISPGCVIKGRVENSILCPGVHIAESATVRNSILMSGTYVGSYSTVESSIIDEEAYIDRFCYLGYGDERFSTNDLVVIGKKSAIEPYTAVKQGTKVLPNSKYSMIIQDDMKRLDHEIGLYSARD
jgi:glucose-1-phosphate adenylyltransferase